MDSGLPNVLVIGAMKAGTTSLHRHLRAHPEIEMSRRKELDLFVRADWRSQLDWYRSHFPAAASVRGESSPNYTKRIVFPGVPARIAEALPDVRLVYILRDPVERILSQYVHVVANGRESRSLEGALDDLESNPLVDPSLYDAQLREYLACFPPERIHLMTLEELSAEPRKAMSGVFRFLGVDPGFDSPTFGRVHHPSQGKRRATALGRVALRTVGPYHLNRLRRHIPAVERLVRDAPVERPPLSDALRRRLEDRLRDDVRRLRAGTGLSFEGWSV